MPSNNPLSTLPQAPSPRPTAAPATALPDGANLYLSRSLQPNLQLGSQLWVQRIDIAGVQALEFERVAAIFQPLTGRQVTIAHLAAAVQQATQLYQQAGYPLSFVYLPEQSLEQGVVRIQAVEGHVHQVHIVGDAGKSGRLLSEVARPIMDSKPLEQEVFTRQTLLMARMLNLRVQAQAAVPATTDGATPLVLHVEHQPVVFSMGADLRQGDPQAIANLTLNDPLWGGSQWQFSGLLSNPQKERFASATLQQWLSASGTTLRAAVSDFKGQDNFAGGTLQDTTTQRRAELTVLHPVHLSTTSSTVLGLGGFALDYGKKYQAPSVGLEIFDREKVRALQASLTWQKTSAHSAHQLSSSVIQGIAGLGAGSERSQSLGQNPAKFDFTRWTWDYVYRRRSASLWGFAWSFGGQLSTDSLPTSERIAFGSFRYGRGYRAGEAAGDQGVASSVEINRQFRVPQGQWVKHWEPYLLYEAAQTRFHSAQLQGQQLRSTSVGMRFGDDRYYALDLSIAKPQGFRSSFNPDQKLRWSMSLTYQLDF